MEVETIVLENGKEYVILDTDTIEGKEYTLFSQVDDDKDICFRKTVIQDGEEYYTKLDTSEELKMVAEHFGKKLNG